MAEAFAALGIAANIFQFLELGFKATQMIVTTYRDIDIDGLAQQNAQIALTCSDFEEHCSRLKSDEARVKDDDLAPLLTRCIDTATKLGAEIVRLRVPDSKRHRRRTKVKISMMSYWKSNTIKRLQADLVDIRDQICFRLQGLIYEHHRSLVKSVDAWGEASKEWNRATEQKLNAMTKQIKGLLKSESKTESGGVSELAQALAAFAEEARKYGINKAILESLHFTQIKERQNEIPKAHKDTFKWIFSENAPGNFTNWLQESNGIFWVSGRPGSGKSTLMKFILGHKTTEDLARTWASPKPLLLASHFFWFGGTKLQKSREGLLRTILFQILSKAPELISNVMPDRIVGGFQYLESWSLGELSDAFERLQALPDIPYRIFIFVDGLDEYSGQGTEVTEFLQAITKSPDIKVCCASRPWQEFRHAFSDAFGQIQMHDLTSGDMRVYVQSTLEQTGRFKKLRALQNSEGELLADSICTKAEGVFFWVSLVVKSLVRGLNNDDSLETLQRRVSEFPPELEQFFQRMIDSIEDVYKSGVDQVFSMLLKANTPLPLILFMARKSNFIQKVGGKSMGAGDKINVIWRRGGIEPNPKPSINQVSYQYEDVETHNPDTNEVLSFPGGLGRIAKNPVRFQNQLLSQCRDLVQAWQPEVTNSHLLGTRLGFLHRTVVEFLQHRESQSEMSKEGSVDWYLVARSCLCILSFNPTDEDFNVNRDFILWFLYILQEANALITYLGRNQGYMLFNRCEELIQILNDKKGLLLRDEDDSVNGILRLLALAQARILVRKHHYEFRHPHPNHIQYHEDRNSNYILREALQGSGCIEVGDRPQAVLSNSIDLELLDNLLQIDGFKKHVLAGESSSRLPTIWEAFITELPKLARGLGPRNAYEACEIMINNGAAKSLRLNDDEVDVIQYLRDNNTLTADNIETLEALFPPDMSTNKRSPKKKWRKRAFRKGKNRT